jgi:hypothetical protein
MMISSFSIYPQSRYFIGKGWGRHVKKSRVDSTGLMLKIMSVERAPI